MLLLLFLNGSVWLAGSFLFIHLEGSTEAAHKCGSYICVVLFSHLFICVFVDLVRTFDCTSSSPGVKRVQRNFVDELWLESQVLIFALGMETKTASEE